MRTNQTSTLIVTSDLVGVGVLRQPGPREVTMSVAASTQEFHPNWKHKGKGILGNVVQLTQAGTLQS